MLEFIGIGVVALGGCVLIIISVQYAYYRFFEQINNGDLLDRERMITIDG